MRNEIRKLILLDDNKFAINKINCFMTLHNTLSQNDKIDSKFVENSAFTAFQNSHYIYLKYFGIKLKNVAYKLIEYKSAYKLIEYKSAY